MGGAARALPLCIGSVVPAEPVTSRSSVRKLGIWRMVGMSRSDPALVGVSMSGVMPPLLAVSTASAWSCADLIVFDRATVGRVVR